MSYLLFVEAASVGSQVFPVAFHKVRAWRVSVVEDAWMAEDAAVIDSRDPVLEGYLTKAKRPIIFSHHAYARVLRCLWDRGRFIVVSLKEIASAVIVGLLLDLFDDFPLLS
jgi:hypothetical protein